MTTHPTPGPAVPRDITSSEKPWQWTATRMASAVVTGLVSSREVVTSCLERIDEVNPHLNALVEVRPEEALALADDADRRRSAGEELGPLHGVPVSIKVNSDQAGYATTQGVVAFRDAMAKDDSPHVASLRRAGAVLMGRSNSPAFAYRWFTNNDLHGRTLNPWDSSRTPGGSSGGASSAVASGMVPVAGGNDIGGSVRYPAYACGVVGLRPTVGRVAQTYHPDDVDASLSVQTMLVQGPLARSVADIRLTMSALGDFSPRDPAFVPGARAATRPERPLRIGLVRNLGVAEPTQAVNASLDQAAYWLQDLGYLVEEIELPVLAEAYRLWYLLCMEEFRLAMPMVEEVGDEGMQKAAAHYYAVASEWWGDKPTLETFINGYARRGTLIRELATILDSYPIILLPVSAEQAFEQDADIESVESMRRLMAAQASMMAIPVLGFPAMSVPTGVVHGLPTGVQLLGRRFDEDTLLDAAAIIEARAGTFTPIDPL
ncbi:amidase family protein [Rhodococcus aetherivorans]|uniref:amidase family protein n=1 Tax=Rhodococcus aetherivorans TaxID=191292 RepID=UPI00163B1CEA|nr:amidase family protein [Rhodococcus aetherivorans]MBC2592374.1 amidase family protein [Rhodococcus aetherivorans]